MGPQVRAKTEQAQETEDERSRDTRNFFKQIAERPDDPGNVRPFARRCQWCAIDGISFGNRTHGRLTRIVIRQRDRRGRMVPGSFG